MSDELVETSAIERVPRTPAEREALLRERPEGWEFLLFAAWLYEKESELEPRWEAASTRQVFVAPTSLCRVTLWLRHESFGKRVRPQIG